MPSTPDHLSSVVTNQLSVVVADQVFFDCQGIFLLCIVLQVSPLAGLTFFGIRRLP